MHLRRLAGDNDEEETVNTSGRRIWKSWYKGQRVIKSAGVVGGRICLFSLLGHFGAAFTYPFPLLHNHLLWVWLALACPFSFSCFYDISWTLMTRPTVTSLFITRHTHPTYIASLLTLHVLYLGYPSIRNTHT